MKTVFDFVFFLSNNLFSYFYLFFFSIDIMWVRIKFKQCLKSVRGKTQTEGKKRKERKEYS